MVSISFLFDVNTQMIRPRSYSYRATLLSQFRGTIAFLIIDQTDFIHSLMSSCSEIAQECFSNESRLFPSNIRIRYPMIMKQVLNECSIWKWQRSKNLYLYGHVYRNSILVSNYKNHNEYSILEILSIFVFYAQSVHFRIFQFAITA